MLHILGMIGKGIGIALICILILVIAILLALLFVPIRYNVSAKLEEGKPVGKAKAHWLLHFVTAYAIWDGKLRYGIKLLGISVYGNQKKKKNSQKLFCTQNNLFGQTS